MTRRRYLNPLFGWRGAIASSDLTPRARHVALTLSLHMSELGDSCFPKVSTLAVETGLHRATVFRALVELRQGGYLQVDKTFREDGGRGPSRYTATIPAEPDVVHTPVAQCDPPPSHDATDPVATPRRTVRHQEDVVDESVKRERGRAAFVPDLPPEPPPDPRLTTPEARRRAIARAREKPRAQRR